MIEKKKNIVMYSIWLLEKYIEFLKLKNNRKLKINIENILKKFDGFKNLDFSSFSI